jgi:release factor glutamine methyltransferase
MRALIKKIVHPVLNRWYQRRTKSTQGYRNHGVDLLIFPDVFHPGVFLSTNIFIRFLKTKDLQNKRILELGAGSGMISFFCAKQGAEVTASDINENALDGLRSNAERNQILITVVASNLFESINPNDFDMILINPPYYPRNPQNQKDEAFYCGVNFEYFHAFFTQIEEKLQDNVDLLMILSVDCDLSMIKKIGMDHGFDMKVVHATTKRMERNYIFQIVPN